MTKRGNPRKPAKPAKRVSATKTAVAKPVPRDPLDAEFRSMMSATRNRCGTCRFFRPTSGKDTGECRLEAPQADLESGGLATWPNGIDPDTGWCGSWESL